MRTNDADALTIDLVPFRDDVQTVIRRGKNMSAMMLREGYDQMAINRQEDMINAKLRDLRIRTASALQDCLTKIISDNR
jgi:reverse gyrase